MKLKKYFNVCVRCQLPPSQSLLKFVKTQKYVQKEINESKNNFFFFFEIFRS